MKRYKLVFALGLAFAAVCSQAAIAQPVPDQYYNLEHKLSGQFIFTAGTDNGKFFKLGGPITKGQEDRYALKLVASHDKDYFYLIHKLSGKYFCTEPNAQARLHLWGPLPKKDEDSYLFKLFDAGEGYYYLLHKSSGRYVYSESKENGGGLSVSGPVPEFGQNAYKFRFVPSATAGAGDAPSK